MNFSGYSFQVVKSGHKFYDDMSDTEYVVEDGNPVVSKAPLRTVVYLTQNDYEKVKEKFVEKGYLE